MKARSVLAVVAVLLSACGQSAPSKFFVLSAQPDPPQAKPQVRAHTTIALGAINLPGALDRPQIARRLGPNEIDYAEDERWAGPLDEMMRRVLAADLAPLLPVGATLVPTDSAAPATVTIAVDISRFDADAKGKVTLEAGWEMLGKNGAAIGTAADARIADPGSGPSGAAVTAAMSRALADLAGRIAAGIGRTAAPAMR